MKVYDTEAIVLRTADYSESDRLVTYLTPAAGKLVGIAKHARKSRKRFAHTLEPCSLVVLRYKSTRGLAWIERSKLLDAHLLLREDMLRWSYAALLSEILAEMTPEGEEQIQLYELVKVALNRLSADPDPLNTLLIFTLRFMHTMGYLPEFTGCGVCRVDIEADGQWDWHVAAGEVVCSRHCQNGQDRLQLDLGTLLLMKKVKQLPLDRIWCLRIRKGQQLPIRRALLHWVMGQTRKQLKTLKVVAQFERNHEQTRPLNAC